MMKKGSLFSDTFEELVELGKSTVQKTGKTVQDLTVGAVKKAGQSVVGQPIHSRENSTQKSEKAKEMNHTLLDIKKIESQYKSEDKEKTEEVRRNLRHYFDLQKSEEKKAVDEHEKEEQERVKMIEDEEGKKKKEEESKKQEVVLPKGKERKNIFSPKKIAKRSQVETRVGSGKQ